MTGNTDFSDLSVRIGSALVLATIAGISIWYGQETFRLLLLGVAAVMAWETAFMHKASQRTAIASACVVAVGLAVSFLVSPILGPILTLAGLLLIQLPKPQIVVPVCLAVLMACWMLSHVYGVDGVFWCIWIVACVIASDVGGYFGGKMIGGPKFWPAVSPKKTWAGILVGWFIAAIVSFAFEKTGLTSGAGIVGGVMVAAASQAGDILESAMKRRAGVKDSSSIIPGHGGFFDRFDGLLMASIVVGCYSLATGGLP